MLAEGKTLEKLRLEHDIGLVAAQIVVLRVHDAIVDLHADEVLDRGARAEQRTHLRALGPDGFGAAHDAGTGVVGLAPGVGVGNVVALGGNLLRGVGPTRDRREPGCLRQLAGFVDECEVRSQPHAFKRTAVFEEIPHAPHVGRVEAREVERLEPRCN